ncbi:MAG TPA: MFS transporter [Solirubrobacteraceae bacterium]|nr:MFS transporter [Solirubrobacteraceae bacterium]
MSRYRWTILAVGVGAQMSVSALRQGLPSLGPTLRSTFHLSLPQLGVILGSVSVGIVLTLIPWGALADWLGERTVLGVGLTGTAVALAAASFASGYAALVIALVVAGMFGASATGASGRAVMGWFRRSQRGLALGIRQTGVPLGGVAAVALPLIVAGFSLRAALLALAAGCLVAAAAGWHWMRESPPPPRDRPTVEAPPPLRDRRLWRLAAGSGMLVVAQASILGFVVVFLHDEHRWSVAAAAAVLGGIQVAGSVMRVVAGRWSDHRDERVAPMRLMAGASSVLLVAVAALTHAPGALVVPALVGAGVLAMSWNGLSFTAAAEMSGRTRAGTAISVQNTVLSAGGALAPMAFAALVVATSWPAAWIALTAFQLGGVLVLGPSVAEERRRRAARRRRLAAHGPRQRAAWHSKAAATSQGVHQEAQ